MKKLYFGLGCFVLFISFGLSVFAITSHFKKDWRVQLLIGNGVRVDFNDTIGKFDDSVFTGDWRTDPMGSIAGGQSYWIKYSAKGGWVVYGPNQSVNRTTQFSEFPYPSSCANPLKNELCIWGRVYRFTNDGYVFDREYGHVGRLLYSL